jgi:type VI secretion system protein ImpJ
MTVRRFNPVVWSEGMFLRPHHLQQRDVFEEERLRYHLHAVDPFHWGVRELVLDDEALSDHRLAIQRLDAVMPGGTVIRYPTSAVLAPQEFDPKVERLEVHLGLRHVSPSDANVAPAGNGAATVRNLVRAEELPDLNRGGYEMSVDLAFPNLRLFFSADDPELELYESFKLAEIHATGELARPFALAPTYCPPLLRMQACPPLYEEIEKIVSQIAAKVRVVAGRTTTVAIADLPRMWMRYTLARVTPVLRHLLSTGETHPFDLYTALVETAGALSAFKRDDALEVPIYDHQDLYGCFHGLIRLIDAALQEAVPTRFRELPMPWDPQRRCYATSELNVQLVDPRNLYYLAVRAGMDAKELAALVVDHGKAGSRTAVATMVLLNVKGLRLEHMPAAPTEIAARAGYEHFKIDPHGNNWNKVREEFSFALNLAKLENADVRLYVVTSEG